jgi:HAD superfamily hydrolase (TIGR01549 family)
MTQAERYHLMVTTERIGCVALDFDGVVVDSMQVQELIWRTVARRVLGDEKKENQVIHNLYCGNSRDRMFNGIHISNIQKIALRKGKDQIWSVQREHVKLMRGAKDIIPTLKERYRTSIVTTADREYVEGVLHRERLMSHFDVILTDDDVANGKPNPDMILELGARLSMTSREILLVGDTATDFEMSKRADCEFVLMMSKPGGGSKVGGCARVENWSDLGRLLRLID